MAKNRSINKKDDNKTINIIIILVIVFLIGALALMFINNDKTGNGNNIKKINYSEYQDIISKDKYSIILLTNPTCSHCNRYKPYVNYIADEYKLDVYDIDLTSITYEEYVELHDKYTATRDNYGENNVPVIPTPATIIAKNNGEVASILGDIGYDGLVRLLKNNKVIK